MNRVANYSFTSLGRQQFFASIDQVVGIALFAGVAVRFRLPSLVKDTLLVQTDQSRLAERLSSTWDVKGGLAQGRVLSPLLFNIVINGLAASIRRVCRGVQLGTSTDSPRVPVLLYADDVVILADTPEELQAALDAVSRWGRLWRFEFGVGPEKSAVMCIHRPRQFPDRLRLGDHSLPFVHVYPYLGVRIDDRLSLADHVSHLHSCGERLMAKCLA